MASCTFVEMPEDYIVCYISIYIYTYTIYIYIYINIFIFILYLYIHLHFICKLKIPTHTHQHTRNNAVENETIFVMIIMIMMYRIPYSISTPIPTYILLYRDIYISFFIIYINTHKHMQRVSGNQFLSL